MLIWKKSGSNTNYNSTVWSAIKSGTPVHLSIYFSDSGIRIEDQDVSLDSGLALNDIFNGDIDLVFGKTISRQLRVRILNSSRLDGLSWTSEFESSFKVTIGTTEYTAVAGYFTGEKPKNVTTARYIDFTAYDGMKKFDVLADDFVNNLTYPKTVAQIFSELCSYVGVTAGSTTDALANALSRSFASAPVDMIGYTCRDILAWIAEACGCYAVMNGHACDLVWFTDHTAHSISQAEEFSIETGDLNPGLTWDEFDALSNAEQESMTCNDIAGFAEAYAVDQVLIKQIDSDFDINYPYALGGNVYMITGNPFLSVSTESDVTSYVKPIYDRLIAFGGYLPIELNCIGDPAVQAGDVVTVNVNGTDYTIPIFLKTMRWNGMCFDDIETTGQIPRSTYNTEATKQREINANNIKIYVKNQYYDRKSGIEITDEGVSISGDKYIVLEAGNNYKWRYDDIGISLKEDGDDAFNYKFWIGENVRGYAVQRSTTALMFHSYNFADSDSTYEWHELVIGTARKRVYNGTTYASYYQLNFGVGFDYEGSNYVSFYPGTTGFILGDSTHGWSRVYSQNLCGYTLQSGYGRVQLIPTDHDMQTRFQILTDANHMYCQKAGSSAKDLIFRGSFEGGVVGQTTDITDMDNLKTPGHYWIQFDSSITNAPSTLGGGEYCEVIVTKAPEGVTDDVHQTIIYMNTFYQRLGWHGTTWYPWYKFTGTAV